MKQLYSIAVLLLLSIAYHNTYAEIIFSDTLGTSDCYEEGYSLIPFENGYMCNSAQLCPNGSNQWEGSWLILDENGDSVSQQYNEYSGYGKQLRNGDILIYGGESAGLVFDSVFIHRLDQQGQWLWTFKSFVPDCSNAVYDVDEDKDGNIYVCGTYASVNCLQPAYQSYIFKLDANGNLLWSKTYTNPGGEIQYYDIKAYDNKLLVAGFKDTMHLSRSIYYAQIDDAGELDWTNGIRSPGNDLNGYSIAKSNNKLYVLGYDDSLRLFISSLDGQFFDYKTLGASCGSRYFHIENSLDGYLLILAVKRDVDFSCRSAFSKIDSNGNVIWEKNFGGILRTFYEIDSGSYLLSGYSGYLSKAKVLRFDTTYTSRPPAHNNIFNPSEPKFDIVIYPNPANRQFYIENPNLIEFQSIRMINVQGEYIAHWNQSVLNKGLLIPDLISSGIYHIQFTTKEGEVFYKKLVLL